MGDDPAYLPVGTAVSAKYKGAFCEAKVSKVVRVVKCKITYKGGLGTSTLTDEHIRGPLRIGHTVQARHPDKKEYIEATITKIQDCSQYTVVFDDGDITTLRRTALCLKSGRHFNESETLDQLPLTHPEHWGFPVGGGRAGRGRRSRGTGNQDNDDDMSVIGDIGPMSPSERDRPDPLTEMYSSDIGKVVCVEAGDKKKSRDNWFPGLVVVPSAQPTVRINVREEYLIRSFKDGRYYTVPRKEILEFSRDMGRGVENTTLQEAMERALKYLDLDELPAHWERGPLFDLQPAESDSDAIASDSSDDEPREEKDHFVAQLYKFMDDRGTPLNKNPTIAGRDVDLYRLFRVVHKLGGCNRVTNQNKWRSVAVRLGYAHNQATINSVRQAYKKFLLNFEDFYRKLGCTMINHPRSVASTSQTLSAAKKSRGRSLIRDRDRATPSSPKPRGDNSSEVEKRDTDSQSDAPEPPDTSNSSSDLDGAQTPRVSKSRPKSQTGTKRPAGEKVKALVDKFEEHARASSTTNVEEEKPSQRPRSKSVGPQRSTSATSGRATPGPRSQQAAIQKEKKEEKDDEREKEKEKELEPKEKEKEKPKPKKNETKEPKVDKEPMDNKQQRGRKKKEETKSSDKDGASSSTQNSSTDVSEDIPVQPQVTANVGDKLKVYYGPTHESKVTYEAKVLDIDRDHKDGCVMYLVHYTGWNMRYDEWIRPQRIAENLSAQNKAARQSKMPAKSSSSNQSPKTTSKRGRGISSSSASTSKEPRSVTPQQSTRSPSRRAQSSRRTRRTSVVSTITSDTDNDDNADDTKSDSEPEILPQSNRTRSSTKVDTSEPVVEKSAEKPERKRKVAQKRSKEAEKTTDDNDKTDDEKPLKRAKRLVKKPPIVEKTTDESDDDSSPPKGRDFDLNQIRSELKGFEKAVKVTVTNIDASENTDDKSSTDKSISEAEKPAEKSSSSTDDIYEFKEPEPFEFESRKLTPVDQEKGKKRVMKRDDSPQPTIEKSPPQTPKKKGTKSPQTTAEENKKRTTPNTYRRTNRKTPTISEDTSSEKEIDKKLDDDLFDKLAESPSYNVGSSLNSKDSNKNSPKSVKLNLDSDSDIPPLFRDLPPSSSVEIGTSVDDSGSASEDLGPEPPPFDQQPSVSTLDHIFKGFTDSGKPIEPPSLPSSNTSIEKTTVNTVTSTSDDDDPIGAAIHRVMSHQMTDESSSGDELFIRTPTAKKIESIKIETSQSVQQCPAIKQISPALQETDSRLLEAISQQTQNLFKKEEKNTVKSETEIKRESPTPKPMTKIADTLLQKLSMIKKIEETSDSSDSQHSQKDDPKPILLSPKPEIKSEPVQTVDESPKKAKLTTKTEPVQAKTKTLVSKTETKPTETQVKEKPKPVIEEVAQKRPKTSNLLEKSFTTTTKFDNTKPESTKTTSSEVETKPTFIVNPKTVKLTSKTDPKPTKIEPKPTKTETKSPKPELKTTKPEVKTSKPEIKVSKPEVKISKPETKPTKPEVKISKPELKVSPQVKPSKPELKVSKPDPKVSKPEPKVVKPETKLLAEHENIIEKVMDIVSAKAKEEFLINLNPSKPEVVRTNSPDINLASVSDEVLVKKRPIRKQAVSREYVESDSDSTSSSDQTSSSETDESSSDGINHSRRSKRTRLPGRLVIAQDEDSQDQADIDEKPLQAESSETIVSQVSETKEDEPSSDISLLLCKETIPGSPASSEPGVSNNNKVQNTQSTNNQDNIRTSKPKSAKSLMLEMPFASAPSNTNMQNQNIENSEKVININLRSPPPLIERIKNEDVSPRQVQTNQNQSVQQQSKVSAMQQSDIDILGARRVSISRDDDDDDNSVPHESKKSHEQSNIGHVGRKRRRSHRANDDITGISGGPSTSSVHPPPAKRGRKPLNRNLNLTDPNSDDEQINTGSSTNITTTQAHRTPPRLTSHIHPRYNFLVELDPSMDGPARINLLQQKLTELRKTYNEVKTELAIIDRRRKKLRRRERDQLKQHKQEMMQAAA